MIRSALLIPLAAIVLVGAGTQSAPGEERSVRVGGTPLALVATPDSLWVLTCDRRCSGEARASVGRILRIDPQRGRVVSAARVSRPGSLAVGAGGVYVTDFWSSAVRRVDPMSLRTTARLRLELPFGERGNTRFLPRDVGVGEDGVWLSTARGAVAKVDLRVSRMLTTVRLSGRASHIAVRDRAVWVAMGLLGAYRISAETNRVVARVRIGTQTQRLTVDHLVLGADKVFAVGSRTLRGVLTGERALVWIDGTSNEVETVMTLPSGPIAVAFGNRSVWVGRVGGSSIDRIDASTRRLVRRYRADVGVGLAITKEHVWTAARDGTIRGFRSG